VAAVRKLLRDVPGWNETSRVTHELWPNNSNLLGLANDQAHDGAHILASYRLSDRQFASVKRQFEAIVADRHRVVWLDFAAFNSRIVDAETFRERIASVLDFESKWRDQVRPSQNSPVLLPESSFDAHERVRKLWEWAKGVCKESAYTIEEVKALSERFRHEHHPRQHWVDAQERRFVAGRHAIPADRSRLWKLSYRVPDYFDWDVTDDREGKLRVRCVHRLDYSFSKHTNIDCHGYIRGGS
jgi:hypothetical protein